jgi:hypothetical protein
MRNREESNTTQMNYCIPFCNISECYNHKTQMAYWIKNQAPFVAYKKYTTLAKTNAGLKRKDGERYFK